MQDGRVYQSVCFGLRQTVLTELIVLDSIHVGPSDCDEERVERTKEALGSWKDLIDGFGNVGDTHLLLGNQWTLSGKPSVATRMERSWQPL